ncbi:hypothetical protein ACEPAI_1560 [Sanghuangporus weigelae]
MVCLYDFVRNCDSHFEEIDVCASAKLFAHDAPHKHHRLSTIGTNQRSLSTQLKDKNMELHRDSSIVNQLVVPLLRESIMPAKKYESLRQVRAAIVEVQLALEEVERADERVGNVQDQITWMLSEEERTKEAVSVQFMESLLILKTKLPVNLRRHSKRK